jgi:hypothetical protein
MSRPSFTDLCFDVEILRFDAVATLQALCNQFEPKHTGGGEGVTVKLIEPSKGPATVFGRCPRTA